MAIGNYRNRPCPCGSGKKFKYCHLPKNDGWIPDPTDSTGKRLICAHPYIMEAKNKDGREGKWCMRCKKFIDFTRKEWREREKAKIRPQGEIVGELR